MLGSVSGNPVSKDFIEWIFLMALPLVDHCGRRLMSGRRLMKSVHLAMLP